MLNLFFILLVFNTLPNILAFECPAFKYAMSKETYWGWHITCEYKHDHGDSCLTNAECLSNKCENYTCLDEVAVRACDLEHPCNIYYYCPTVPENQAAYCRHQHYPWTRCNDNLQCLSEKCGFYWCH